MKSVNMDHWYHVFCTSEIFLVNRRKQHEVMRKQEPDNEYDSPSARIGANWLRFQECTVGNIVAMTRWKQKEFN